jgi:hypothetical protein
MENIDPTIEEIYETVAPAESQEGNSGGDSIVDETDGNFKMPEATITGDCGNKSEVSETELTDLEKEIEAGKVQVESDIRARAAAAPPKMSDVIKLVPELKGLEGSEPRYYVLAEIRKYDVNFNEVDCTENLGVLLSELREAEKTGQEQTT